MPALQPRAPKARPDANPLRLMLGMAGIASASAITAAMLPSVMPAATADAATLDGTTTAAGTTQDAGTPAPSPSVLHVTRYVTLAPGQTAPPQSTVVVRPQPTPQVKVKVKVVTQTRQSGAKP